MNKDDNRKWIFVFGALFLASVGTWVHFFPPYFSREQFLDALRREVTSDTFKSESRGSKLIDLTSLDGRVNFIRLVETAEDCYGKRIVGSRAFQRVAVSSRKISIEIEVCPNKDHNGIYLLIESHRGIKGQWLNLLSRDPELVKRYNPLTMKSLP